MKLSRLVGAVFAGALAAVAAAESQAQVADDAAVGWGGPGYGPYAPFRCGLSRYRWIDPWGPRGAGACVDNPYLRRAIQREIARQEYLRELEKRAQPGFPSPGPPFYGLRRDEPPPTPEAQVQPAYRRSGEIWPEFTGTGQFRQDSAGAPR